MKYWKIVSLILILASCQSTNTPTPSNANSPSDDLASFTSSMNKKEGFFNFYYDEAVGKIFLEVDKVGQEFLYVHSLAAGIGSNDIGLDRGQLGGERVVKI